jgi:RimJ/RimL family protein N-acetyltransferase
MEGSYVVLEPLSFDKHAASFWSTLSQEDQPLLFKYMFFGPLDSREAYDDWFRSLETISSRIFFSIIDKSNGIVVGVFSYMEIYPDHGSIELGSVVFTSALRRSRLGTEAVYLMLRYCMDDLKYRRFEWKCDNLNERSKVAALRYGFTFEGVFRQHRINKNKNRDTFWGPILDKEWRNYIKESFILWLKEDNFDENNNGMQRRNLKDIRDSLMMARAL